MGNKIITEEDFWICTGGAVPAQLQTTQLSTKQVSKHKYITVNDKATSSWIDFGCKKLMLIMAILAAVIAVAIVATGGAALAVIVAAGVAAGAAGAAFGAVLGALICGQKAAPARVWNQSKSDLIIQGFPAITGDHTMTCRLFGETIRFAPNIKNWWQAIALGGLNYLTGIVEGGLVGGLIGLGGGLLSGAATLGIPTLSSIAGNVAASFGAVGLPIRALFGADKAANEWAVGDINSASEIATSFADGAVPEAGSAYRIATGQAQGSDAMLLLYLLHIKGPRAKSPPKEEPVAPKEEPVTPKKETPVPSPTKPAPKTAGKPKTGKAYEQGKGSKPKLKAGTPEHKAARWEKYKETHPDSKMTYEEWSNRYDANMKNARRGNSAADNYQKEIGWGKREVSIDVNGKTRKLDIADKAQKKGVEVKDYEKRNVPFDKEIKNEAALDKELMKDGWDIEWIFKGKGPSKPLQEYLDAPPPIKWKKI